MVEIRKINTRGQFKIQQMAFMIMAVFFFFILVGLFFVGWVFKDVESSAERLQEDQSISSMKVIADMTELNCDSREDFCLDEDKLKVMTNSNLSRIYADFWPVASVKVYRVYPAFDSVVECPGAGCNYYEIFDNGQRNTKEFSTYVSICKKLKESGYVYDRCDVGKLLVGVIDGT